MLLLILSFADVDSNLILYVRKESVFSLYTDRISDNTVFQVKV